MGTVVVSKTYLYALVIAFSKGSISFSYGTSCEISACGNSFKLSSLCHLVFKWCMGFNSRRTVSSIVGSNASPNQFASPSSKKEICPTIAFRFLYVGENDAGLSDVPASGKRHHLLSIYLCFLLHRDIF